MTTDRAPAPGGEMEALACPFCGKALIENVEEEGRFWTHPGRNGFERVDCWLGDVIVDDKPEELAAWNRRSPGAVGEEVVERAAKAIYDLLPYDGSSGPKKPAWVPRGNSLKQDESRRYARAALSAAGDGGRVLEGWQLVPKKLTREMELQMHHSGGCAWPHSTWRSALSTAPSPVPATEEEET